MSGLWAGGLWGPDTNSWKISPAFQENPIRSAAFRNSWISGFAFLSILSSPDRVVRLGKVAGSINQQPIKRRNVCRLPRLAVVVTPVPPENGFILEGRIV